MFLAETCGDIVLAVGLPESGAEAPSQHTLLFNTLLAENYIGSVLWKVVIAAVTAHSAWRLVVPLMRRSAVWFWRVLLLQYGKSVLLAMLWAPKPEVQVGLKDH
jgi:hypothetical protein